MSKEKLEEAFAKVAKEGQKAFVPYIMAGDGGLEMLEEKILFLQDAGVTAIELGIPFSDPVADGPTIQQAGLRALEKDTSLRGVLSFLEQKKDKFHVPIVLMTYFNPIYQMGLLEFSQAANGAGVSGVIIPDLPVEQSDMITPYLRDYNIALIQLISLVSPLERIQQIAEKSEGFLYAVTVNGITGARKGINENLKSHLERVKKYSKIPVLAGFGISTPEQVKEIGGDCDGVIVGSKIISLWEEGKLEEIQALAHARLG